MFGIGMPEMILILAVALIVIGPKKLPDLAKTLGKAMGEFKKATSDLKDSMQIDTELKEVKTAFDDMDRDVNKESGSFTGETDETSADGAGPDETPGAGQSEDGGADPVDTLKTAFDRRDKDASDPDAGSADDGDAPATGSGPDSETHKG